MKGACLKNSGLKRVRLWFLLLVPIVAVCVVASSSYIHDVGKTYAYPLEDFRGQALEAQDFTIEPPEMAEVVSIEAGADSVPVATFAAGADGEGAVIVGGEDGGMAFEMKSVDGVLVVDGVNFTGWEAVLASVIVVAGSIFLLCLIACARLLKRAWFGYEMAAYAGAALFFGVQTISFLALWLGGSIRSFFDLAISITALADNFVFVSLVPMIVLAVLVSASNVVLVRRLGRRPLFMLGIVASLAWLCACLAWWIVTTSSPETYEAFIATLFADSMIAAAISFVVCLLVGVSLAALLAARHRPAGRCDYLIILGCRVAEDGRPMTLLAARVDAALAFARSQVAAGQPLPAFVPSGGQGLDEPCSEAESIGNYLAERGVPQDRILLEDRATNTRQNMLFSAEVIAAHAKAGELGGADGETPDARAGEAAPAAFPDDVRVAFSTTNYHVLRGYVCAHKAGMDAEGIAAPAALYYWPNAFLREFAGMVAGRALPIAGALVAIEALYALAEYAILLA